MKVEDLKTAQAIAGNLAAEIDIANRMLRAQVFEINGSAGGYGVINSRADDDTPVSKLLYRETWSALRQVYLLRIRAIEQRLEHMDVEFTRWAPPAMPGSASGG